MHEFLANFEISLILNRPSQEEGCDNDPLLQNSFQSQRYMSFLLTYQVYDELNKAHINIKGNNNQEDEIADLIKRT